MKITDIAIERYGVWRDLNLSLHPNGLNVFYGPNEAGKTTLMRFLRGMLYGFQPLESSGVGSPPPGGVHSGVLKVTHGDASWVVRRTAERGERGRVTLRRLGHDAAPEQGEPLGPEMLEEMLGRTEESVFENVFAVGLHELQELATLNDDHVAQHVYGMTLGAEGERLREMTARLAADCNSLFNPERESGELYDLINRYDRLTAEIDSLQGRRHRHDELIRQQTRFENGIAELKQTQKQVQSRVTNLRLLQRVWGPWSRLRELNSRYNALPVINEFPEDGLERLDELDQELQTQVNCRDSLVAEADEFRKQAEQLTDDLEFQQHVTTVQSFVDQSRWLAELDTRIQNQKQWVDELKDQTTSKLEPLGPDWTVERLAAVDTMPTTVFRLMCMGRNYQSALDYRARLRRRIQSASERCQQRQTELNEEMKRLGIDSPQQLQAGIQQARQEVAAFEELGRLKLRESELSQRRTGLGNDLKRLEDRVVIPKWVKAVLAFFGVSGLILAVVGIATGVTTNSIAGIIYSLLGITCGGLAWALKIHFEDDSQQRVERVREERRECDARLQETRAAIHRLIELPSARPSNGEAPSEHSRKAAATSPASEPAAPVKANGAPHDSTTGSQRAEPSSSHERSARFNAGTPAGSEAEFDESLRPAATTGLSAPAASPNSTPARASAPDAAHAVRRTKLKEAELIQQATHRLVELERLWERHTRNLAFRRRSSQLRSRFQGVQREVNTARQNWCEMLKHVGLDETVRIDEAFQTWQTVIQADERRRAWVETTREFDRLRTDWELFRQRIEELGHRMHRWEQQYDDPLKVLAEWEEELRQHAGRVKERHRLRHEEKLRRTEAGEYEERIGELRRQRSALLVRGGAAERDEFEERANAHQRRRELAKQIRETQAELESARRNGPETPVRDQDLISYDAEQNAQQIASLESDAAKLHDNLQRAHEKLGRIKHEIDELQNDRRPARLRLQREQLTAELKRAAERWFATQWAAQTVENIQAGFERSCQPATLASASQHLSRLSCGKYGRIWAPLGRRRLLIDDSSGETFGVEQLSGGTREQLFLAVRLAIAQEFCEERVELPMVLDDCIVNFDQQRTEAAVDQLLASTVNGQQLLFFTCHLHLAHLFESRGITPIWLPSNTPERRAG